MFVLIRLDGTTEPVFRADLLGVYETIDDARESMRKDVGGVVWRITKRDALGDDYEVKRYLMGAHVFLHELFWQWIIFDSDEPHEWNSMLSW